MIMMPKEKQFPRNHSGLLSLGLGFRVVLARDLIPNLESESAASGSAYTRAVTVGENLDSEAPTTI